MQNTSFIIKPLISEKSLSEANKGRFTFVVEKKATKNDVKSEIEKLFSVEVIKVYISHIKGNKIKHTRKGRKLVDLSFKKARVQLAKDQKIDLFEAK